MNKYNQGIAFIVEGDTELVFYEEYLSFVVQSNPGWSIVPLNEIGVISFELLSSKGLSIIKMYSPGTITQVPKSGIWFVEECYKPLCSIPWIAVLAYDTDGYNASITKFHEGDWELLRSQLSDYTNTIIDLAACADIEDAMLCDLEGIISYLGLPEGTEMPTGRKGKSKMKKLFKEVNIRNKYREGQRARTLIRSLDMGRIEQHTSIPLSALKSIL